jgi:large conductance mechanosensitive channel
MLKGFKEFIARGNAVDLAVGVVLGAAFGAVITSVVDGIINPIVGAILPGEVNDLAGKTVTIGGAAIVWGTVVSTLITFVLTAAAVYFLIVVPMNELSERRDKPAEEMSNEEKMVELLQRIADRGAA